MESDSPDGLAPPLNEYEKLLKEFDDADKAAKWSKYMSEVVKFWGSFSRTGHLPIGTNPFLSVSPTKNPKKPRKRLKIGTKSK